MKMHRFEKIKLILIKGDDSEIHEILKKNVYNIDKLKFVKYTGISDCRLYNYIDNYGIRLYLFDEIYSEDGYNIFFSLDEKVNKYPEYGIGFYISEVNLIKHSKNFNEVLDKTLSNIPEDRYKVINIYYSKNSRYISQF
jgi:hypothetical protein